jgi:hypothetical protein
VSVAAYQVKMTEAAMRSAIMEAVARLGGRVFYVHDSRYAPATADLPDLVVILPGRGVYFWELKSNYRAVTPGQAGVIEMIRACASVEADIIRPNPKPGEMGYDDLLNYLCDGE